MKRLFFLATFILCLASTSSAQSFKKGSDVISLGTGYSTDFGLHSYVSYERGVIDLGEKSAFGVGTYVGYASNHKAFDYKKADCGMYYNKDLFIALSGNYHYTGINKIDLYGGVRIGYDIKFDSIEWVDDSFEDMVGDKFPISDNGIAYDLHVGARYYPVKWLALNIEAGYGISIISGGLSFKF